MSRTTLDELKKRRLGRMTTAERREFETTYAAAKLALSVGDQVRNAREAAGLSQRVLASRMGTSQAAIARLEAGGVGSTLTTLQRVASALDLEVSVTLYPHALCRSTTPSATRAEPPASANPAAAGRANNVRAVRS